MEPDPRIYFASERTLLAWLRTGIAVIGLGFLVARFGLFLRMVGAVDETHPPGITFATVVGTVLVIIGSTLIAVAGRQHHRFGKALAVEQQPANYWISFSVWVSVGLALCGAALSGYLVYSIIEAMKH